MTKLKAEHLDLLGKSTDQKIADAAGCNKSAVSVARKKRGIAPADKSRSPMYVWDAATVALLGTMADGKLAAQLGVHQTAVCQARRRRKIAPFGARR